MRNEAAKTHLKPPIRILVIDDQLAEQDRSPIRETICNYFCVLGMLREREVYVDFADTPEKGVKKWKSEIYDLTLVDSDFQKSSSAKRDDEKKLSFLDLNVEFVGAYLCRFLHEMLVRDRKKGDACFRAGCKVVFWTALTCKDKNADKESAKCKRAGRVFDVLELTSKSDPESSVLFVPKDIGNAIHWRGLLMGEKLTKDTNVESCVTSIEEVFDSMRLLDPCERGNGRSWLARAITWYKTMTPLEFARTAGLDEPCAEGYLSWQNGENTAGTFQISSTKPDGDDWVYLSPSLRKKVGFADCVGKCPDGVSDLPLKQDEFRFPEKVAPRDVPNVSVIAAATPLTGCSVVGKEQSLTVMARKINALLAMAFDRVVLKTVYLNEPGKVDCKWPTLQIQRAHRARCYRSAAHPRTLWNTGTTAQESFSPEMMNEFLANFQDNPKAGRVIVSLGSKFPDTKQREVLSRGEIRAKLLSVWDALFAKVFKDLKGGPYADVEINVRHYLRGCIAANLGGDEYLSPLAVNFDKPTIGNYSEVDAEFEDWLDVLNDVALRYGKNLYLKMPLRGDLVHFIGLIGKYKGEREDRPKEDAIKGLVFVNAFKSALKEPEEPSQYSPAWYGSTKSWNDRKDDGNHGSPLSMRCQVSGELLQLSRNQLLFAVAKAAKAANLELQIGGGVIDHEDLLFCSKFSQLAGAEEDLLNAVQIGTWGLMDLRLGSYMGNAGKLDAAVPCSKETRPHEGKGACTSNRPSIGENLSPRIAFCLHELCNGCGKCSRSFYCDTFLDRRGHDLPPVMDARNCTGCGLCAQICPNGAIQLFRPEDMVMLIAEGKDILLTWHRRLDACEIPHLCYMAEDIRGLVQKPDCRDSDLIQAWYDLCQAEAPHLQKSIVLYAGADESLRGGRVAAGESADVCQEMRPCPLTWEWKNGVGRLLSKGDPDDWLKDIKREVAKRLNAIKRLNAMRR